MTEQIQPTAEAYWSTVQYIADESGEHDIYPKTDEDWQKPLRAAEELGRLGELLQTEPYIEGRGDDWKQFAQGMVEVSKQAKASAEHKSTEEIMLVGETIYNVCVACHERYLPLVPDESTSSGTTS